MPLTSRLTAQRFQNGEIHDWFRFVHGFSDHLVANLLDRFGIQPGETVLDPFCGTGTTLIECMKRGIDSVGIDANPASCFASRVKAEWGTKADRLIELVDALSLTYRNFVRNISLQRTDITYRYLEHTGMLQRGWISQKPLIKAIALKGCIQKLRTTRPYKNALMLALVAEVIRGASNVKFGPELYCGPPKDDWDVLAGFANRVQKIAEDLRAVANAPRPSARLIEGDARECDRLVPLSDLCSFSAVISSPPYPAEHDYTRNTRLELAFLEMVTDRSSLRAIKKSMLRSHTKGIYKGDNDKVLVETNASIRSIVRKLEIRVRDKDHGFAPLYPTVIQEYFGGMQRHFRALKAMLRPGAKCAYIVGDQSAYLQVRVPTARILRELVRDLGYINAIILRWRSRWSTSTSRRVHENILLFDNP